jgi:Uma2 family endonuclease
MDTQLKFKPIARYYDGHREEIEGVELSQSVIHTLLMQYLVAVLKWLYHDQSVFVANEINLYYNPGKPESHESETPLTAKRLEIKANNGEDKAKHKKHTQPAVPDIMVIPGVTEQELLKKASFVINEDGPAPSIVLEIASDKTWTRDFREKKAFYQKAGIQEYFIFDPHTPQVWSEEWVKKGRLVGYRLDATGVYQELANTTKGLPSTQLDSWLVTADNTLRLYDQDNKLRLTEAEYQHQRATKLEELLRRYVQNPEELV